MTTGHVPTTRADPASFALRCEHWYRSGYYRRESLAEALARAVSRRPDTPLHFHTEQGLRSVMARDVWAASEVLCGALQVRGLRREDVFALQLPTSFEAVTLYVAAFRAGATVLPLVHNLGPADVEFILRDSCARWFATPDTWYGKDFLERLAGIPALDDMKGLVVVGDRGASARRHVALATVDAKSPHHTARTRPGPALRAPVHLRHDCTAKRRAAHAQHDPQ